MYKGRYLNGRTKIHYVRDGKNGMNRDTCPTLLCFYDSAAGTTAKFATRVLPFCSGQEWRNELPLRLQCGATVCSSDLTGKRKRQLRRKIDLRRKLRKERWKFLVTRSFGWSHPATFPGGSLANLVAHLDRCCRRRWPTSHRPLCRAYKWSETEQRCLYYQSVTLDTTNIHNRTSDPQARREDYSNAVCCSVVSTLTL